MIKEDKEKFVQELTQTINEANIFYLANIEHLDASATSSLRRKCFENGVELRMVRNTLLKRSLENAEKDYSEFYDVLKGNTSIMFSNVGKAPAVTIKSFRKKDDKPLLKAAYIEEAVFIGDNQLDTLANLKSREELIGDIVMLLQSPIKNVVSGLKSSPSKLAGIVEALGKKKDN